MPKFVLFSALASASAFALALSAGACTQTQLLEGPGNFGSDGGSDGLSPSDGGPREPELLAKGIMGGFDIVVDGTYVYIAAMDSRSAFAVPKAGGDPIVLGRHTSSVLGITVDANRVYWGVAGGNNPDTAPGLIVSTALGNLGGEPEVFKTSSKFAPFSPWSLANDEARIYCGGSQGVFAADKASKAESALGGGQIPTPLVLTSEHVYWVSRMDGVVMAAPKNGGPSRTIATGPADQSISAVTADEERVYWLESDGTRGRVFSIPAAGGKRTELAVNGQAGYGMAIDAKYIYWTVLAGGSLNRVPKGGGPAEILAVNIVGTSLKGGAVATDEAYVYWTNGDGNVFRLRKD